MTAIVEPTICIAGPTAAGKSAVSQLLASHLPVEIINVDSATIYRGMDIGTAKPTTQERGLVPHHLLDILDPAQSYSAAQFRQDALACISAIRSRQRIPILVGGTMLYFKILRDGIDELPTADPTLRQQIQEQAQRAGWPKLHEELSKVDPETAGRLSPNDSQRIGRALEVFRATGTPMSALLTKTAQTHENAQNLALISLEPSDRALLHDRIAERFHLMLEQGLVDEVKALFARQDLHNGLPSIRCVGYRQIWDYLAGDSTLTQARDKAIAATRQLAKRQLTWLRSMPERQRIDCLNTTAAAQVLDCVHSILKPPRSV